MPRQSTRPRTAARLAAVQALYQSDQTGDTAESVIEQFVRHRLGASAEAGGYEEGRVPEAEVKLFSRIVQAATNGQAERDELLATVLPADWPIDRLDPVLRALLRAGMTELAMPDGPPARVVINEYVDVAHGFFGPDEPRLVNAVLDRLARILRPAEFPAAAAG
jgi:transcription antitermination protein NusB